MFLKRPGCLGFGLSSCNLQSAVCASKRMAQAERRPKTWATFGIPDRAYHLGFGENSGRLGGKAAPVYVAIPQLAEDPAHNRRVLGSSPNGGTRGRVAPG